MKQRRAQQWVSNNKALIAVGVLALCFFIATLVLATRSHAGGSCKQGTTDLRAETLNSRGKRDGEKMNYRLPRHAIPINYKLKLHPTLLGSKTFSGSVRIHLNISQPAHNVTLHAKNLGILAINLKEYENSKNLAVTSESITDRRELLVIKTREEIPSGQYNLEIEFSGKLEGLVGFYGSKLKKGRKMTSYRR